MDNPQLFKVMEELRQQCRFALFAFQNVKTSLNGLDPEKVFFYVDAFLTHAVVISRLLWPEREASRGRGDQVRGALEIQEGSALRMQGFRTQLEQTDEKFEDWLTAMEQPNYVEMNLMPMAAISDFKPDAFHRNLDPDTFRLHWRGSVCELKPLVAEIRHAESQVQTWLKTHNPW